jgi:hypothetical protein
MVLIYLNCSQIWHIKWRLLARAPRLGYNLLVGGLNLLQVDDVVTACIIGHELSGQGICYREKARGVNACLNFD